MEWDQLLFKRIYSLVRYIRSVKPDPVRKANSVSLDSINGRLSALARLLCGKAVHIVESEDVGGWKGDRFYFPSYYDRADSEVGNREYYLFRLFFLYGQSQLRQCWLDHNLHSFAESTEAAKENAAAVIELLSAEFPSFRKMFESVVQQEQHFIVQRNHPGEKQNDFFLYGKWYYVSPEELREFESFHQPVKRTTVAIEKDTADYTEKKGPGKEETEILLVDTEKQDEYTLTHNFEKIETLDTFSGRWRDFDGTDDLEEHSEALQELDLRQLVRVDNPVHSIYKTEFVNSIGLMATASSGTNSYHLKYDEWDSIQQRYRPGYCNVFPAFQQEKNPAYAHKVLEDKRSMLHTMLKHAERFITDYYIRKRMPWGDEPDLDAMVDAFHDRQAGYTPSENLYTSRRKRSKEISILVLTDSSLSTDGYTNNFRILDIEKEALILVSEIWEKLDVRFQLDTFSSRTHNHCTYQTVKAFHQTWPEARDRVGAIESGGYTRIGPAIRHAVHILENVRSETKWLMLLTDGKPNDYDRYEGVYGIRDTRKAIHEASCSNIHVTALAVDAEARYYLPQMFGNGGFEILRHPQQLPLALLNFYLKILK